jgi:hypothetical protein
MSSRRTPALFPHQMKSVQWLQKVGCLKKRAVNLWLLTSWTTFCLRAPFLQNRGRGPPSESPPPGPRPAMAPRTQQGPGSCLSEETGGLGEQSRGLGRLGGGKEERGEAPPGAQRAAGSGTPAGWGRRAKAGAPRSRRHGRRRELRLQHLLKCGSPGWGEALPRRQRGGVSA